MLAGKATLTDFTFPDDPSAINTHPPQTPFAAVMEIRSQDWAKDFLNGVIGGAGYQKVPPSDALTPPVAITGTVETDKPLSSAGLASNSLVAFAVVGLLGFVLWKTFN